MSFFQIALILILHLVLPSYLLYRLWKTRAKSKFGWLFQTVYTGGFLVFVFLAGSWDWVSYYLRYLFLLLFVFAAYRSYRRVQARPFFVESAAKTLQNNWLTSLEVLLIAGLLVFAARGFFYSQEPVSLEFPLQEGRYYVGQGGNSLILNAHHPVRAQQFAVDIKEIYSAGIRAEGIYPQNLAAYAIFGETIYSPCSGPVIAAADGLPDNIPPETDREHLAGNHVVLQCAGARVLLAHMQNGSVLVQAGDQVSAGQPLGRVGNSGNTTEPHLHIHAVPAGAESVMQGRGLPLLLDGRFPVRNTVFVE